MAQRRMFSQKIVGSDAFMDMPTSSRELYFQLGIYADDDGFVSPKMIMRMCGASEDDLKVLLSKRFVLQFENGVLVVKHWRINNLVRKDWYEPTKYIEEKNTLLLKDNGAYTQDINQGKPLVNELLTQVRLGKDSIDNILTDKQVVGNDIELLTEYFIALKGLEDVRPQRYFKTAGEVLTLCNNSLLEAKKLLEKLKVWADKEGMEWEMETAIKKYLILSK